MSELDPVWHAERMADLIQALAPAEGYTLSALEEVRFLRANHPIPRTPVLYEPCIVVLCKGRKRGYLADRVFDIDARHFLAMTVPMPFESETFATPQAPMLAMSIRVDLATVADLALSLEMPAASDTEPFSGMHATPMDARLGDAVIRLMEALSSPMEARILGPAILREIYYRVLTGEQGAALRAALTHQGHFGRISRALRLIHANFNEDLDVGTLAATAAMSAATFHAAFKRVTGTSPIQYIKATRLHKARLMMVQEGLPAASAAARVGYESPSQFSREFKRLFGRTPSDEAQAMKEWLALRQRASASAALPPQPDAARLLQPASGRSVATRTATM